MNMTKINELEKFNALFSEKLINFLSYNHIKKIGGVATPTKLGHGPFCELTNGAISFDLRTYQNKPFFGYSHPIELKSQIANELNLLENNKLSVEKFVHQIVFKKNIFLENYQFSILQNLDHFKNYKIIDVNNMDDISLLDKGQLYLVRISYTCFLNNFEKLQNIFQQIEKKNILFGIIEEFTLGLTKQDFIYKIFTSKHPAFLISNFNLPFFCCWSKELLPKSDISQYCLELCKGMLRFLYEASILDLNGRIDQISKNISSLIKKYNFSFFSQSSLSIMCSADIIDQEKLQNEGILAESINDMVILCFPLSIKEQHLNEIFRILDQNIK